MVTVANITRFFQDKETIRKLSIPEEEKKRKNTELLTVFPTSPNNNIHWLRLVESVKKLAGHYDHKNSSSSVFVGGSFPRGKVRNIYSDLDFFIILPHIIDEDKRLVELQITKDLPDSGFLISEDISTYKGLLPVIATGRGLARLSGFTLGGIQLDFHFIGIDDALSMGYSRAINRVKSVEPYPEWRVSYTGKKYLITKPSKYVLNRFQYGEDTIKGFYLDNFSALGESVYDPYGIGKITQARVWENITSVYISHANHPSFDGFIKTLYYQNKNDYSNQKLAQLRYEYDKYSRRLS